MNKRTFLKKSALIGLGGLAVRQRFASNINHAQGNAGAQAAPAGAAGDTFIQPPLPYAYDALEPTIDAMTMEIHYTKHHAGYTRKLNAAVEGTKYAGMKLKDMFAEASELPMAIRNNGGGFFNHRLFWKFMSPKGGGMPKGELADAINSSFGSFDNFKDTFSKAAATRFGSGWAWLISTGDKLEVTSTPNQDNPLMDVSEVRGNPLLGIDVWEHAYYLKYQNRRTEYIAAFWNIINWDFVSERFMKSM